MADPAVVTGAFTLGAALSGGGLAFLGQWWMEHRTEAKQQRTAVSTVLLELALLSGTIHSLVRDQEIRRPDLEMPAWARYGPELVHALPVPLIKALHIYIDGFEGVRRTYLKMKGTVHVAYAPYLQATMLSWACSIDRLAQHISGYRKRRKLEVTTAGQGDDLFLAIVADVQKYAVAELERAGLPFDKTIAVSDDVDLSVPPSGWRPAGPDQSNTSEETES